MGTLENYFRELEARYYSDLDIHREVFKNLIKLDCDLDMKIEIMLQAIPDIAVCYLLLKESYKSHALTLDEYEQYLEATLKKLEENIGVSYDFDPRVLSSSS